MPQIKLNENKDCFTICQQGEFCVYNTSPLDLRFRRDLGRGLLLAEALQRSNIVALVYQDDPTKVVIWDDNQDRVVHELTFKQKIRNLLFRGHMLLVALEFQVLIYGFNDWKIIHQTQTVANPLGLADIICLSLGPNTPSLASKYILAVPHMERTGSLVLRTPEQEYRGIKAHQNPLSQICLSPDGQLVATSSERGTIIRIWQVTDGKPLKEVRRGLETTEIYSISFSPDSTVFCVTGKTGTAHFYLTRGGNYDNHDDEIRLMDRIDDHKMVRFDGRGKVHSEEGYGGWLKGATKTIFKSGKSILPKYFYSEGSFLQISLPGEAISAILDHGEIYFWTKEGQYLKFFYQLDPPGYKQLEFVQLI